MSGADAAGCAAPPVGVPQEAQNCAPGRSCDPQLVQKPPATGAGAAAAATGAAAAAGCASNPAATGASPIGALCAGMDIGTPPARGLATVCAAPTAAALASATCFCMCIGTVSSSTPSVAF